MQWVQKAVQYYKDINPATLTGAIDVIVVERPTESGDVELACSPFHVRFGKLSILRPIDKKVHITINDHEIPFYMKVGETGEAFFVFETDADVPEDLQTSPIAGPVPDDEGEAAGGPGEPDFLDLNASEARSGETEQEDDDSYTPESSPSRSRYVSLNPTQFNSPTETVRQLPSLFDSPETTRLPPISDEDKPTPSSSSDAASSSVAEADEQDPSPPSSPSPSPDGHHRSRAKAAMFVPAALVSGVEAAAGIGKAAMTGIGSTLGNRKLPDIVAASKRLRQDTGEGKGDDIAENRGGDDVGDMHASPNGAESDEVGQLEQSMRADLSGMKLSDQNEQGAGSTRPRTSNEYGDDVRRAAASRRNDVSKILGGPEGLGHASQGLSQAPVSEPFAAHKKPTGLYLEGALRDTDDLTKLVATPMLETAPEKAGDLMLDMSGYKLEEDEEVNAVEEAEGVPRKSIEIDAPLDDRAEEEIVAFTQGLLQSTDPKTLRGFFDPSDSEAESSRAASPVPADDDVSVTSFDTLSTLHRTRPKSITSLQSLALDSEMEPSPTDGVFQSSPNQFTLRVGERVHVFELSLCGTDDFGHSPGQDERVFIEHQVSFSQFMEHDDITDRSNLVVKYGGRYLTWDNASPVLASLAVYRKSLVEHPEHHRRGGAAKDTKVPARGWFWWGRRPESSNSVQQVETSPPASPPPSSRPDSPAPEREPLPSGDATTSTEATSAPPIESTSEKKHYAKTLRLTSDQLKELGLKKGMNVISFSVRSSYSGFATCTSRVFLWESNYSVVISDIDGTITKSDALGHVFTMIGRDWTHLGVAKLYTDVARNGYKMMYLTSRAIGQADTTREYLKGIKQNGFQLPDGPVIMSPDRLMTSFHREVILRKPEVFKMACLRDIQRLFHERSPFYAGFGNRITDALSYRTVGIPSSRIFTIDTNGEVKMELLELAGYKSSYIHMHDLVDQMFPPINKTSEPEFTDFNFWRAPVLQFDIPDLSPPSPALSARSDSSMRFPRLGSLASSLSRRSSKQNLVENPPSVVGGAGPGGRGGRTATPSSPLLQATVMEEPGQMEDDDEFAHSESESMPGSLPNESEFERLRRKEKGKASEAEAYKEAVLSGGEEEDQEEEDDYNDEEEDGGEDDFGDQLDFSSVPYL